MWTKQLDMRSASVDREVKISIGEGIKAYITQYRALYTSNPGRPVHSNIISTSLGNIQPCCNYCSKIFIHICTTVCNQVLIYGWLNWGNVEWTKLPKLQGSNKRIRTSRLRVHRSNHYTTVPHSEKRNLGVK